MSTKSAMLWDVTPYTLVYSANVSKALTISIFSVEEYAKQANISAELHLLGYNAVKSIEYQETFPKEMKAPSSGSKNKLTLLFCS
jgi:hypothetical protein